jgi:hypothetical protein
MERRAVEAAFDALAEASGQVELAKRAQTIADYGCAALPVLLARLDTEDPHLRVGLGLVAQRLGRELVAPALKAAIRSRERSDQARVTALTLLERYLEEPADEGLRATIQNPEGVARQSLRELIGTMAQSQNAIIEYLTQLAQQPADAPGLLMQALPGLMPNPHLVTLLRMFAQGEDARLAQQAIEQLGRTRMPEACLALVSLAVTLPPERAALAERGARKLRMSGVQAVPPDPPAAWQALISPVDGAGAQMIWFICRPPEAAQRTAFSLITQDPAGILAAVDASDIAETDIPPSVPEGETLSVPLSGARRPLMLVGTSLENGRQAAYAALKQNWQSGHPLPLPYRFLNYLIWQYGAVGPAPDATAETEDELLVRHGRFTATLLDHPAFTGWFWQAPVLYDAAEKVGLRYMLATRTATVEELTRLSFGAAEAASYRRRLQAMARWLQIAGQPVVAELAQVAAAQLANGSPAEAPFVRRLIGIGLDVAVLNLQRGHDLRRDA